MVEWIKQKRGKGKKKFSERGREKEMKEIADKGNEEKVELPWIGCEKEFYQN